MFSSTFFRPKLPAEQTKFESNFNQDLGTNQSTMDHGTPSKIHQCLKFIYEGKVVKLQPYQKENQNLKQDKEINQNKNQNHDQDLNHDQEINHNFNQNINQNLNKEINLNQNLK